MKKNIAIVVLSLISLTSLTYGYIRGIQAEQMQIIADQNAKAAQIARMEAEQQRRIADEQRLVAMQEMERAMQAVKRAEEQLAKTKSRK